MTCSAPSATPKSPTSRAILPAETTYQIVRAAAKLGFDTTDVLAEVANAATRSYPASPGHQPRAPYPGQSGGAVWLPPSPARPGWPAPASPDRRLPRTPARRHAARPATPTTRQRPSRLAR